MENIYLISGGAVCREKDNSLSAVCGFPQAPDAAEEFAASLGEEIARFIYVDGWDGVELELGFNLFDEDEDE